MSERQGNPADEARLKILVEQMVREGKSEAAIAKAAREAALS